VIEREYDGRGLCPYDPDHSSTAVYSDGHLYTATVAGFSGTDPIIYREPLRTERSDLKKLNTPNFVSSMAYEGYIFFFFRETAVEYMNCGKAVYSRVARVCKHDKEGPHQFGDRWTPFLKSRLNCSVPGCSLFVASYDSQGLRWRYSNPPPHGVPLCSLYHILISPPSRPNRSLNSVTAIVTNNIR
jgi:hypothetical protein